MIFSNYDADDENMLMVHLWCISQSQPTSQRSNHAAALSGTDRVKIFKETDPQQTRQACNSANECLYWGWEDRYKSHISR